jgi:hypothetical protein
MLLKECKLADWRSLKSLANLIGTIDDEATDTSTIANWLLHTQALLRYARPGRALRNWVSRLVRPISIRVLTHWRQYYFQADAHEIHTATLLQYYDGRIARIRVPPLPRQWIRKKWSAKRASFIPRVNRHKRRVLSATQFTFQPSPFRLMYQSICTITEDFNSQYVVDGALFSFEFDIWRWQH